MHYRWTRLRMVDSRGGHNITERWPVNLWRAAHAAAEETLCGGPLAPAWLRLFRAHLSASELGMLRWRGDLGESAEMRRVYSGLYGRYFARTLLASRLGVTNFVSLNRDCTNIRGGVTVERIEKGDIPDWLAWDAHADCYVLGEAKGCLTGRAEQFLGHRPRCVDAGRAQFARVVVKDSAGRRIETRNWVAANLWSTDHRSRQPVALLWDPPDDGVALTNDEAPRHALAIRKHRTEVITRHLGDPDFSVRIVAKPSDEDISSGILDAIGDRGLAPSERPSQEPHENHYLAAVITPLGIRTIHNAADLRIAQAIRERAGRTGEPAMIFGLAKGEPKPVESRDAPWLSGDGIVAPDGSSLFNLSSVEVEES